MARKPYLEFSVEDRHVSAWLSAYGRRNGWFEAKSKEGGCEACLMPYGRHGPIEAHREDYSSIDPDEVIILCYRCHRVLHMRDRYPEAWDFYREKIREGWRWPWAKDIGPVAGAMRAMNTNGAKKVNEPRETTVLDSIHNGVYLKGTPEDRQKRLQELYRLEQEIKSGGQGSLFNDGSTG